MRPTRIKHGPAFLKKLLEHIKVLLRKIYPLQKQSRYESKVPDTAMAMLSPNLAGRFTEADVLRFVQRVQWAPIIIILKNGVSDETNYGPRSASWLGERNTSR